MQNDLARDDPFAKVQRTISRMHRLAEAKTVITDDKTQIDRHVLPFLRAVKHARNAEQHIPAVPDADRFVILFAFPTATWPQQFLLR